MFGMRAIVQHGREPKNPSRNAHRARVPLDAQAVRRHRGVIARRPAGLLPGIGSTREVGANSSMIQSGVRVLQDWNRILGSLVIDPQRPLEELTATGPPRRSSPTR
jgi:hypothetical protein